jgi:UDP-N-acetylmuramyl pentapeptide phosphotransferase/UDP-N-acetylglucosamine-1-phosphate transferase
MAPSSLLAIYGAAALIAAALAALLIRALFPWLQRYALARPNARSSHTQPTAQGGGAAVIAAVLIVAWMVLVASGLIGMAGQPIGVGGLVLVSAVVAAIAVLGAVDDVRPLPVAPRFAAQAVAATLLIGTIPAGLRGLPFLPSFLEAIVLVVGLVWFINLANFMDGIDEITVAEFVPMAAVLAVLAALGVLPAAAGVFAATLAGGLAGFWPWNRHVARLFLGDVGSLAIGALVGWLLILLAGRGYLAAALILPLYYLADATLTLIARARRGEKLSDAHRSHYYQRATTVAGRRVPEVTRAVLLTNLILAALALAAVAVGRGWFDVVALTMAAGVTLGLLRHLVPERA